MWIRLGLPRTVIGDKSDVILWVFFWVMVLVRLICPCSLLADFPDLEDQLGIFCILISYIFFSFFKIMVLCAYSSTSDEKAIRDRFFLVPGVG